MKTWTALRSFLAKPLLRRRLQLRYFNHYHQNFMALAVWLIWASASLFLVGLFADRGLFAALLLLGAIVLFGNVRADRRTVAKLRRDFHWEGKWQHDFTARLSPKLRARKPLPLWVSYMARPEVLELVWRLIVEERPEHALELGSGMSTLVMAYALESVGSGDLTALEDNAAFASNTRGLLHEHGLSEFVQVLDAPLQSLRLDGERHTFYALQGLPAGKTYDFVFIDGPGAFLDPKIRYPAMPLLRELLTADAVIVLDDMDRALERRIVQRWLAQFSELREDESLSGATFTTLRMRSGRGASG